MCSRGMRRQEVQREDRGRVPGEKVEVHWLEIERDDSEKEESKNEGCKVSFGGEVFSLCLVCVWRREEDFLQCCKRTTERISGIYKPEKEKREKKTVIEHHLKV